MRNRGGSSGNKHLVAGCSQQRGRGKSLLTEVCCQGVSIVLGAAHSKELPFPVLIRVLEEGEEDPARDPGKAYPKAFPLLFHLKEM